MQHCLSERKIVKYTHNQQNAKTPLLVSHIEQLAALNMAQAGRESKVKRLQPFVAASHLSENHLSLPPPPASVRDTAADTASARGSGRISFQFSEGHALEREGEVRM